MKRRLYYEISYKPYLALLFVIVLVFVPCMCLYVFVKKERISINDNVKVKEISENKSVVQNNKDIKDTIPQNFLADKQIPNSEFIYTIRWDLFNLYKFQQLSPTERIKEFEDYNRMYTISDMIVGFVDTNQQYQIAENYCIKQNIHNLEKVPCKNPRPISDLPYAQCEWFKQEGNSAKKYYSYDIKSLWNEFKTKGIKEVENEITKEENFFKENN